jgi:serine/threonine protein phosphatase PrpC
MSAGVITWRSSLRSDVGKVRKLNEDSGLEKPDERLWCVADGMNSLAKVKSSDNLSEHVDFVEHSILGVNNRLHELSRAQNQTSGSTVIVLLGGDRHAVFLWAGDSRLYRLRNGTMKQLTTDHTQAELYVEQGLLTRETAADHPSGNMVTRAVGASENLFLDVDIVAVEPGDRFLLCSDGLDKHLSDPEIEAILQDGNLQQVVDELVETTLARGAMDNVTVCAVDAQAGE